MPVCQSTTLEIGFKGVNNDKLYGFYRSKYMDGEKEKHILTTQFEAASARSAFPCFDEPAFKATYDLSLLVPGNMHCISNMTVKKEAKQGEKKVVTFNTTPKMSSYLLYIGVGDFEVASIRSGRLTINCITVPGKKKYTALALGYTKRFIHYFEGYFGIRLPLIKMDVIAVPDFAAGAMENWGAITFRETALLAEEKAAIVTKQRIAEVDSARAHPPVVRRPGHHEVVGRPLAERELCDVHGLQGDGCGLPGVEYEGAVP